MVVKLFHKVKFVAISLFITLNVVLMATASLPDRSAVGDNILNVLWRYQTFFALDQMWSMFAPNPANVNAYLDAEITFKDGSKERWTFPRPSRMPSWEKLLGGERFRKYSQENLVPMEKSEVWFDMSRFVAREVVNLENQGKHREIKELQFYRHFNIVKPPQEKFIPHGQMSTEYQTEAVFHFIPTEPQKVKYEANINR
ncbi:hypothetical protein [Bdellovibrio sp. NC01]|uniref:hypothetical protein n=1 Tax=Bdellovibrio sp. NC01 TaxID=2220073 RepID=UPI00115A5EA0|nr:hypothetical protein [Bdellovibrio sp. NC01]QDK38780.1 hypothetical protein DOE51_14890 [Bdellovibrio sp. NC01]